MMPLLIAFLAFVAVVTVIVGSWWVRESERRVRERLSGSGPRGAPADTTILRPSSEPTSPASQLLARTDLYDRVVRLVEQAGFKRSAGDVFLASVAIGGITLLVGWARLGSVLWALLIGAIGASIPFLYLVYRRARRIARFHEQFPDALDMMTRSIRAGHALSAAIRVVGEEMPNPIGEEFALVADEVRLGLDPGEALFRLERRIATEDVAFFCTAIRIQRMAGGNLAEILDRLAEVIRERFKLLSHARVLSAQHRFTAIAVGLSPIIFSIIFELLHPGYFKPLLTSPSAPLLIGAGLGLEAIGFFVIWRIAQIRV